MAQAETARLKVQIDLAGNASGGISKLQKQVNGLGKSVGRAGKGVGQIGAGIARAGLIIGGAAVTGLGAAAKAAIDFQDAFAGVRKTVDETDLKKAGLSFEKLALSFRKMATEIPIAATEFAAIGETAGALGIKAKDIETFTKTVALLGVTTNLTSDQAAESLGKVGTILNLTGKGFTDFADILVNLGNKGASTESEIIEITKRFGAAGKQAGLSVPQILAFSSAIASAGVEPEAAGSSLSRLFGNLITETALATKKGQAFARISKKGFKEFSQVVKKDTVGAMLLFLRHLKTLSKFGQQKALKAVGITNVRDRNAILLLASTYEKNLIPALENANKSQSALAVEAQKRFDTVASKLKLLGNNLKEAGIQIGEGFTPAIGRAAEKLAAFLKLDSTRSELAKLGQDIGKVIDGINWDEVLRGARELVDLTKGALGFAKQLFDAFNALPGPIKEATAGFLILDKLSGGLLHAGAGNVVGGLASGVVQGLGSKLPGVGRLFAQPVFVTNWPPGMGLGGAAGAAGAAKGGLGLAGIVPLVAVAGLELALADAIGPPLRELLGVEKGGFGSVKGEIAGLKLVVGQSPAAIAHAIQTIPNPTPGVANTGPANLPPGHDLLTPQQSVLKNIQSHLADEKADMARLASQAPPKLDSLHQAVATGDANIHQAVSAKGDAIVAAIWAARPIVNVTNIQRTTTIQERYAPGNGSYGGGSHADDHG